jgi:hypothetical protein
LEIASRPSDTLAVRSVAPIFAAQDAIAESAIRASQTVLDGAAADRRAAREPRGVASGGWRDDRPPCALSCVELKTDRNDLASLARPCSSHASVARLSPAVA